jgi:phosphate-selective porin
MEGDFGQSDGTSGSRTAFSATDIWINWHQFPAAQVKIGQYKAPFGLEQLTPDTTLLTIERTLPTGAITPDRQIGAELYSILGGLNYYYIRGDNLKLMVNYIHTWSDFRDANPEFGDDQFDEVIGRMQLMF